MNFLRTLSIRDVGAALKRREFGLALQIGRNLCSNAIGSRALQPCHARVGTNQARSPRCSVNRACALTQGPAADSCADLGVARALTVAIALGLQITGVYAAFATFGAWIAVGLYAVGGLTTFLQFHVVRRIT